MVAAVAFRESGSAVWSASSTACHQKSMRRRVPRPENGEAPPVACATLAWRRRLQRSRCPAERDRARCRVAGPSSRGRATAVGLSPARARSVLYECLMFGARDRPVGRERCGSAGTRTPRAPIPNDRSPPRSAAKMSRSSMRSSTSSAAYLSHASGSGRVDQSAAECSFASDTPVRILRGAASPTFGRPRMRAAISVSNSRVGAILSSVRQGRSWDAACRIHSSSAMTAARSERSSKPIGSMR